jgi:glycosyltransferase involved in cell wall biosynthesis
VKVFCHIPRENWFCDRYGSEYKEFSTHDITFSDLNSDVIWLLAAWCWNQIPKEILASKKVVCTIHHEVPWKFDEKRLNNFKARDQFVDVYHVTCDQTKDFISSFTNKPIFKLGYWCNDKLWKIADKNKLTLKKEFNLPTDKMIISSFQRDTEGSDLVTPKLEKGPDIFCNIVKEIAKSNDVHVLLNGWRRQFVMLELDKNNIQYSYFELPKIEDVVKMYLSTDLYIVGSRVEGGPQSILECAATKTPIVSTNVGIAKDILRTDCIMSDIDNLHIDNLLHSACTAVDYNYKIVQDYSIAKYTKNYDEFFSRIVRV